MTDAPFQLTLEERQSAGWRRLLVELRRRRDEWRRINDHHADASATAATRGRIAELTRLISLDDIEIPADEQ